MRDLLDEYIAGAPDLMPFYAAPPHTLWDAKRARTPWHPSLVEAIRAYQSKLGGEAQLRGGETVIATGQQPGLFTGPLYTIYKAITAIRVAQRLEERSGTPCVPLFWIAGDDHDFEEARTAHILTKTHEPLELTYKPQADIENRPMYRVPLEESIHALIDRAANETHGSEYRAEIARFLHESADASDSLADWTARLLVRLFHDTPLVLFAPHLPEARRCAAEIFKKEISGPLASGALLNEAGQRLKKLGFQQQVAKRNRECCFFIEVEERRSKVTFKNDRFAGQGLGGPRTGEDLNALLSSSPERFSANVALRCIVQQHLFPVAAYIAGPGELAYWAQLKPLFEHYGKTMPVVYPRARVALANVKLNKLMDKLGLAMADLSSPPGETIEKALRTTQHGMRNAEYTLLRKRRREVKTLMESLAAKLKPNSPNAAAMAGKIAEQTAAKFDRIERELAHGGNIQVETVQKQVVRLSNTLYPFRKPQERVYTIVSLLFEHGWELIPRLIKTIDIESFSMQEIEL